MNVSSAAGGSKVLQNFCKFRGRNLDARAADVVGRVDIGLLWEGQG
ncbi:hypothetical protein TRP8649_02687 [Pelagimonas phthalicica]|uniref:Uncharacterized protein n=1 Tax=Pelagimonas phthalicica TaxID=1037362 RepID=A0A238JF22_9RHOB|nr:hypothetical protein CLV87_2688 [Pelagimonas phthalicica]SMX28562.1 hypothetical protein TRP8649_02687 [Pelagimonas phthalicica]